jgi:serine/threonine protein kinase
VCSIEQKIGEGSFGEVFKGKWRGSELAIKRLFRQQADDRILLELRKESVIMSSLRHPNILLFLGVCIVPPNLCILTEYMKNGSLGPFLRNKSNKLSWIDCLNMGKQAAVGMDYLHSLRPPLIHRDLSSYNILVDKVSVSSHLLLRFRHTDLSLLSFSLQNLRVKIGDFGLSRIKAQNATMTRCGTVAWTAPEVLEGKDYSEKSDVYSFGIILWEL